MKVKVTYTVDHSEIPTIVRKLSYECQKLLREASSFSYELVRTEECAEDVDNILENLDLVTDKLGDCVALSRGYMSVTNAPEGPSQAQPGPYIDPGMPLEPEENEDVSSV